MMTKVGSVIAVLCIAMGIRAEAAPPVGVFISEVTGNYLAAVCEGSSADQQICRAYVLGVADALGVDGAICRPAGVTTNQIVAVVSTHIKARPAEWHYQGYFLTRDALKAAFPCKAK